MIQIVTIMFFCIISLKGQINLSFEKILNKCWKDKQEIFDFTNSEWQKLSHQQQIKYSEKYQLWYSKKKKIKPFRIYMSKKCQVDLILIPPGIFYSQDYSRILNRKKIRIEYPFWIGKYEITQKQWTDTMGDNPAFFSGENLPIENVSWKDCIVFCKKLGGFLPTENQWEYACRAGTTHYLNAKTPKKSVINYNPYYPSLKIKTKEFVNSPLQVGSLPNSNAWGGFDFLGNVFEWCDDEDKDADKKIIRGGAYFLSIHQCTSDYNATMNRNSKTKFIGFRIAFKMD